ncbi:DUF3784 domain-containing protein [Neobacillus notoginsengisoli]|uniref:DUF3784 domain-containing protein n=2 Tax=Neobacillus notoginsengisoli TaxID=1578198 RepID=A0A417YWF2_9BACI|nr:DUF3784 domain-containing protein [Neobacillus notoginsengisoli]
MLFFVVLGTAVLFLLLGWGVRKGAYWLISGYANRSKEEQEQLLKAGYPQKIGSLLIATAVGMIVLLPLLFTSFTYKVELIFGFMIVFLLGGIIYLSRYEIPQKRKRSYVISIGIAIVTFSFLAVLMFFGYEKTELILRKDSFEITGMYGKEIPYEDIRSVELIDELPEVTFRVNGFAMSDIAKGKFKVTGHGTSLLFIQKAKPPYLLIETDDGDIFINSQHPNQTQAWERKLIERIE